MKTMKVAPGRSVSFAAGALAGLFLFTGIAFPQSVNFGQLNEGLRYEDAITGLRLMVWRVRLDFDDFREMQASREVRDSFDAGFTALHEMLHGLGYKDAANVYELGECEETLNRARGELGL